MGAAARGFDHIHGWDGAARLTGDLPDERTGRVCVNSACPVDVSDSLVCI